MIFVFELYYNTIESEHRTRRIQEIISSGLSFTKLRPYTRDRIPDEQFNQILLSSIVNRIEQFSLPRRFLRRDRVSPGSLITLRAERPNGNETINIATSPIGTRKDISWSQRESFDELDRVRAELITDIIDTENNLFLNALNSAISLIPTTYFKVENKDNISLEELNIIIDTMTLQVSGSRLTPNVLLLHPSIVGRYSATIENNHSMRVITDRSIPTNKVYALALPNQLGILAERHEITVETMRNPNAFSNTIAVWEDIGLGILDSNAVRIFELH